MKRFITLIQFTLGLLVILATFYWTATQLQLLTGFPKGVDAYAHLFRVRYVLEYFPQLSLNPFWNSGTPYWIWSYPPFSFFPSAALAYFTHLTPEIALNTVTIFHFILFLSGLFLALYFASGSFWLSLGLAVIATLTPATYSWWGHGGNYVRLFGLGWWTLALATLFLYLKKPSRTTYVLYFVFAALAFGTHFIFVNLLSLSIFFLVLFSVPKVASKIKSWFLLLGLPLLFTSYWLLPMTLTSGGKSRFIQGAFAKPVLPQNFIQLEPHAPYFTLTFVFTFILFFALLVGLPRLFQKATPPSQKGLIVAFGLVTLVQAGYLLLGNLPNWPEQGYLAVITPSVSLPILIVHGFIFAAASLGYLTLTRFGKWVTPVLVAFISFIAFWYLKSFLPFPHDALYDVTRPGEHQPDTMKVISQANLSPDFRFGTDSAFVSDWFNYVYPTIPQTRDYIYQGIPYKNWQFFQESTIWATPDAYKETQWLLDWYAIKYFAVGKAGANTQYDKFLNRPDLFEPVSHIPGFYLFKYQLASPILSFAQSSALLVIAPYEEYETLVRLSALSGLASDQLILAYGGKDLNHYDLTQLNSFTGLILYKSRLTAASLSTLSAYLKQGGKVYLETVATDTLPTLSPLPVETIGQSQISGDWHFRGKLITSQEADQFSPANYQDTPWKVLYAEKLTPNALPLLSSDNLPLIVAASVGEGTAIWSGMNFPYHALSFANPTEAIVFVKLLQNLVPSLGSSQPHEQLSWTTWTPQRRQLEVNQTRGGVLIKESHFPNWHATLNDQPLPIYPAGPNLMYLPTTQTGTIKLKYLPRPIEIVAWVVALGTGIVVILYLFGKVNLDKIKLPFINVSSWWGKDEAD